MYVVNEFERNDEHKKIYMYIEYEYIQKIIRQAMNFFCHVLSLSLSLSVSSIYVCGNVVRTARRNARQYGYKRHAILHSHSTYRSAYYFRIVA